MNLPKLQASNCAKGMLNKSQMSSWIVQARIRQQCQIILVFHWQFNALMFLALQHSTYVAIHDLVARAKFLEAAVLLLFISEEFVRPIQGKNLAWSTAIVLVFC